MTLRIAGSTPGTTRKAAGVSLSVFLARLIWLCVLPLTLLAAWLAYESVRNQDAWRDMQAANLARNTATTIDVYLEARIDALSMLAGSPLADDPARWPDLYREAQGFRDSFGSHVILASADEPMRMLFNTRVPFGTALPPLPRPQGHAAAPAAVATGKPAVGDTFFGPVAQEPLVAIAVPGLRQGQVAHLLLTTFEARHFQERLEQQALPEDWALTLLDGRGEAIARRVPPGLDLQRDVDAEGRRVVQSALSPWSVVLEIPRRVYRAPLTRTALALGLGVLGAMLIGVLGGTLAGRRLGRSVATLTQTPGGAQPEPEIAEIAAARRLLGETADRRTAAEEELRKFSRVVEQTASTVVITDAEGVIEYVNPRFTETSGYAAAEAIGRRPSLLKSGHTTPEEYAALWRTIKAGGVWRGEFHNRRKDGTLYWEAATLSPIRDGAGRITHYAGIKEDITGRKEMEAALRRSAAFDEAALKSLGEGLYTIDGQGLVTYMNPAAEELFGWTFAELHGRKMHDATHHRYRDGRPFPSSECAGFQVLAHGRPLKNHEDVFIRKDGTFFDVMYSIAPLHDDAGGITGLVVVFSDITERKRAETALQESEEQYRAIIETAADGFWMLDGEGRILEINEAYARRSGYGRAELLTMRIADLEAQESPEEIRAHIEKVQRNGSDLFETRHRAKSGEVWPAEVNASYWAGRGGRFFGFLRDITDRKRTEAALDALHAEMEQLMKQHVASQTAAAIAHELNQPLIAVASYAEAAQRLLRAGNPQPDRLRHAIEGSAQQAQRAGQVVRELLAFMKVGEVQTEPVDLNGVVRGVLARVEENAPEAFQARLELEPDLPAVRANRLQIEKVLSNLVQNGIEAMREAGISPQAMTVAVRTGADGSMAQVTVQDSGPGIDAQALHRIFDPFFTTKTAGLGMGLAISRAIVEAHGGQLWLEVGPGPGATFHFTLPFDT
jgi:PAS domain S-box-containing protein